MGKPATNKFGYTKEDMKALELVKKLERQAETMEGVASLHDALEGIDEIVAGVTKAALKKQLPARVDALKVMAALAAKDPKAVKALLKKDEDLVELTLDETALVAVESGKKKHLELARHLLANAQAMKLGTFEDVAERFEA